MPSVKITKIVTILIASLYGLTACGGNTPNDTRPYFVHLSDIHLDTDAVNITYGQDTGSTLWQATKTKLQEVITSATPPQFILYTGDLPAHYACTYPNCYLPEFDRTDNNDNMGTVLNELRQFANLENIPLLYATGNNDSLAGDYHSFADAQQKTTFSLSANPSNPFPALNTKSHCGSAPCMVSNPAPTMDYYAAIPIEGLRVILLNSIILGAKYYPVDGISHLHAGNMQMQWFATQLAAAASNNEKVAIAMHIPPGLNAYAISQGKGEYWMWAHLPSQDNSWLNQFLTLTERYQKNIIGILYGHTHMDELRRLYDLNHNYITAVALAAPGITPNHYNNPGFKLVFFDEQTKELMDSITYYTTPNATEWNSYQFSTEFNCPQSYSIFNCLEQMSLTEVNTAMDRVYTVMHGEPRYNTTPGIEVYTDQ
ncbi:metallophosphoesterase [Shewanella surugensis]|uniref:Metallophosphoesterase n=1 Tax=Shewanella surugensis TaxID=212020 RepID=A0ABT0LJS8_9GAMM|nr:metallophosphoesterase [Shewanella surugensis]MCL1127966.1 metallophosphoesterase [Shewanella surugensis]